MTCARIILKTVNAIDPIFAYLRQHKKINPRGIVVSSVVYLSPQGTTLGSETNTYQRLSSEIYFSTRKK